jgi:hypothetical protein
MQVLIAHEDETVKLRVLAHPDSGWIIGIRQYVGREEAEFTEFRTGLDHFAFTVGSRDDLTQWEAELSRRGIPFTPTPTRRSEPSSSSATPTTSSSSSGCPSGSDADRVQSCCRRSRSAKPPPPARSRCPATPTRRPAGHAERRAGREQ